MSRNDRFTVILHAMVVMASLLVAKAEEDLEERANGRRLRVLVPEELTNGRSSSGYTQLEGYRGRKQPTNVPEDAGYLDETTLKASLIDRVLQGTNASGYKSRKDSPLRGYNSKLYSALSRIAKVSSADHEDRSSSRRRPEDYDLKKYGRRTRLPNFTMGGSRGNPEEIESYDRGTMSGDPENLFPDVWRNLENRLNGSPVAIGRPSKTELKPKKFHCHPIEDVYIPEVGRKMPAYACKLGRKAFVLSSVRFFEDCRPHVDVTVDETTFQRLTTNVTTLRNSMTEVINARLVLKPGEDNYDVRSRASNGVEKAILQGGRRGNV